MIEDGRFWVIKKVMDSVEEKGTAKILVCLSEWSLWTVRGGRLADVERDIGEGM